MTDNNTFYCSFVSIQYIICECGDTFPSEDALKEHLEKDNRHKVELKNEGVTVEQQYSCGECDATYSTEMECLEHQTLSHLPIVQEDIVTALPDTMASKPVKIRVQSRPVKVPKTEEPEKRKKRNSYVAKNVVCETCGKKYASNAALRYHQRVHTGVRPYQCSYCPKNFTMSLFLQIHQRIHTGEKPYECPHCPKAFTNKAALLRHDRVHTGVKPYHCPKCNKSFSQSNSMKLHVHTVHLKMPAPYKSKKRRAKQLEAMKRAELLQTEVKTEIKLELEEEDVYYCDLQPEDEPVTYEIVYEHEIQ